MSKTFEFSSQKPAFFLIKTPGFWLQQLIFDNATFNTTSSFFCAQDIIKISFLPRNYLTLYAAWLTLIRLLFSSLLKIFVFFLSFSPLSPFCILFQSSNLGSNFDFGGLLMRVCGLDDRWRRRKKIKWREYLWYVSKDRREKIWMNWKWKNEKRRNEWYIDLEIK